MEFVLATMLVRFGKAVFVRAVEMSSNLKALCSTRDVFLSSAVSVVAVETSPILETPSRKLSLAVVFATSNHWFSVMEVQLESAAM